MSALKAVELKKVDGFDALITKAGKVYIPALIGTCSLTPLVTRASVTQYEIGQGGAWRMVLQLRFEATWVQARVLVKLKESNFIYNLATITVPSNTPAGGLAWALYASLPTDSLAHWFECWFQPLGSPLYRGCFKDELPKTNAAIAVHALGSVYEGAVSDASVDAGKALFTGVCKYTRKTKSFGVEHIERYTYLLKKKRCKITS